MQIYMFCCDFVIILQINFGFIIFISYVYGKQTMKTFVAFFASFCLAMMCCSCSKGSKSLPTAKQSSVEQNKGAVLVVDQKIIDFGSVNKSRQDVVKLNVKITNEGDEPLALYKVDVSCGC